MINSERVSHDAGDDHESGNQVDLSKSGEPEGAAATLLKEPHTDETSERSSPLEDVTEEDEPSQQEDEIIGEGDGANARAMEQEENLFDNFVAPWIQASFPEITDEADLRALIETTSKLKDGRITGDQGIRCDAPRFDEHEPQPCEECSSDVAVFACEDCSLALCFRCIDAIHIIPSLSMHNIRIQACETPRKVPEGQLELRFTAEHAPYEDVLAPGQVESPPKMSTIQLEESRLALPTGTSIFFRASDCARWPRELLNGTLVSLDTATRSGGDTFYHRVLWLRGVEALPNGFFRASLVLPGWDFSSNDGDSLGESYWPQEIGVFPTQLSAFRAVVTAEQIGRSKFRRERTGGRLRVWNEFESSVDDENIGEEAFPSSELLDEIITETVDALGRDFAVRLWRQDDVKFHEELSRGTWSYRRWMEAIGRADHLREEDVVPCENIPCGINENTAVPIPWPPATRIRFFMVAQHDLVYPERVCKQHLRTILDQLLFVYAGFAWRLWRDYVTRHREWEERENRRRAAIVLQGWARRMGERRRERDRHLAAMAGSSMDALERYRRRQVEARKLYTFLIRKAVEWQRNAIRLWRVAVGPCQPLPPPAVTWHPGHGMKGMLPKLPRIGARRRTPQDKAAAPGSQLVVEDAAAFKLFRANHAGPVDNSYWVIRARVLAGVYPVGPAFREARRLVSRTDFATSVLLQQMSVFVCLMTPQELSDMETTEASATEWSHERQVRTKYQALCTELKGAETVSKRHVELARQALTEFDTDAAKTAAAAMGSSGTSDNMQRRASMALPQQVEEDALEEARSRQIRETLEQKLQLALQQFTKASNEVSRLATLRLEFLHFPIAHDGVPESEQDLVKFLAEQVEPRLRSGKNVYIFSRLGHGRTGLVAALLLGRVYGITSAEALDRAQRTHDCQRPGAPKGLSFCSPTTALQVMFVRRALSLSMDPIYAPLVLENSSMEFRSVRNQQRGLLAEPYLNSEGFMISTNGDERAREQERVEQKRLQRIARRESAAAALQYERRDQQRERGDMELEDFRQVAFDTMSRIYVKLLDESSDEGDCPKVHNMQ